MPTTTEFHYVYFLASLSKPSHRYVGLTTNLAERLAAHNAGRCPHTREHTPWQIETAVAFRCQQKATAFERYLKTHSGRSFARNHF